MGVSFSQRQSDLLLNHFASVHVNARWGTKRAGIASEVMAKLLTPKVRVRQVELPTGVQPDQLSSAEINVLVGPPNRTS
jgi:hypothetical protein